MAKLTEDKAYLRCEFGEFDISVGELKPERFFCTTCRVLGEEGEKYEVEKATCTVSGRQFAMCEKCFSKVLMIVNGQDDPKFCKALEYLKSKKE